MIGNAYRIRGDGGDLTFFFDKGSANLIPMVKSVQNFKSLQESTDAYFGRKYRIHFRIGNDPEIKKQREKEVEAMDEVKAHPSVQFILERFKGSIVRCTPISPKE